MKPETATEQTVLEFFATLGRGDLAQVPTLLHPEVTWRIMGRGVPGAGLHRGAKAIIDFITPVRELFEPGSPRGELTSLISKGLSVVFEMHGAGKLRDGRDYDNYYAMAVEVRDGLIYAIREYMDTYYVRTLLKD
jgi:ketosteroid isomerase-like protein